jgi:hypothetical protein
MGLKPYLILQNGVFTKLKKRILSNQKGFYNINFIIFFRLMKILLPFWGSGGHKP